MESDAVADSIGEESTVIIHSKVPGAKVRGTDKRRAARPLKQTFSLSPCS